MQVPSRRGFLRTTLGTAWTAGCLLEQSVIRAAAARGQSRTAPAGLFVIEKIAAGVYGALGRPAAQVNCNGMVFELADSLLVVDTHSKPSAAAALIAQIRTEVSPKPVRYLVNSHFHWDHTQGNPAYRKAFPNVRILASESTRQLMREGAAERLKSSLDSAAQALEAYRKRLAGAKEAAEKAYWQRMVSDTESFLKEMKDYAPELPDVTVRGDLVLHDKAQELQVVFRGRGHTAGDVSVWSPSRKCIATGDLAHGAVPYMGDGFPLDWPRTLSGIGMLDFDKMLGGHGDIETGRQRLDQMRDYLEELGLAVERGRQQGRPLDRLAQEITPATLKSMGGGYAEALMGSSARWRKEGLMAPGFDPIAGLAAGIRSNVAQVYAALGRMPAR
jgi:glyoxylase-like metal-dependent hydrolase (beta-lactamase superfamily II)